MNARRRRLTIAGLCLAVLLDGQLASAQSPRPALAGTTTVVATASSTSTQVVLTRDVTFSGQCYPESAVTVTGSAASVVVALVPATDPGNAVFFGRFPREEGAHTFSTLCGAGATLRAGSYTLAVVRTPGTASVTLRLRGLAGRRELRPSAARSAASVSLLTPVAPYDGSGSTGSFGSTGELTGKGQVMVFGWLRSGVSAVAGEGSCVVEAPLADTAPPTLTQAPGCPLGSSGMVVPGPKGSGTSYLAGGAGNVDPGRYSASFYYLSQARADSAGGVAVWVPNAP